ncbi:MAG TPA: lysylphosphatidylglycerol synthase domain-containing protein [Gemmatimonadales bacterium]|nr:lysylphosphatidylglycerol synthase domain-containing protein [Gemmatimonadales bacterium]
MRRWLWWTIQLVVAAIVIRMVWATLARNWSEFRSLHLTLQPQIGWIGLAVVVLLISYASSVEAWRRILAGWHQHLPYMRAARIWLVANLGRYIPGKVWSVAGLMALAQRSGVEAWAAGASAFAIQAVAIGTAVAIVAVAIPGAESPLRLAAAALVAMLTIASLAWPRAVQTLARLVGRPERVRPLPVAAVAESSALGIFSWLGHGTAFWLLSRGLGLPGTLPVTTAVGVFALGYILGLLALFAPGGVGVREVVLISLLTPMLGGGGAIALSLASRLLLTVTEVAAPLAMLLATRQQKEDVSVRT